jgi:hypothetical protein
MKPRYDFSNAERGKFFHQNARLRFWTTLVLHAASAIWNGEGDRIVIKDITSVSRDSAWVR